MKLKTSFLTALGTATLSLATLQLAQAAFVKNQYNCEDAYMEVAYDCGNDAIVVEKNRLNKIYMSAYRTLNATQQQQLDKEQRIWLKDRNDKCDFEYEGPMNNSVVYAQISANVCTANETQKRSKVIAKRYNVK
ncbi:lysozyme inhibitor LprI family protein [Psychrobacter glacincola]|uniref:lysozyme inhibitor LprI family protein n=1 Tax=Psychrobacter glacincola TaxID=56810 RepID=UPI00191A3CBF|nr:lysozyme inhibitor LprI family protein [Psychrobacter glacincola]